MVDVIYLPPQAPPIMERHIAVVVHRDGPSGGCDKGYFYDSEKGDHGGSGPFDQRQEEVIAHAKRFADEIKVGKVVVRARLP